MDLEHPLRAGGHPLEQACIDLFAQEDDETEDDARVRAHGLRRVFEYTIFTWVATIIVSNYGEVLLQRLKKTLQTFGGGRQEGNMFFMSNKLRVELFDESSIELKGFLFVASPVFIIRDREGKLGLVQVIGVPHSWLAKTKLISLEVARNKNAPTCDDIYGVPVSEETRSGQRCTSDISIYHEEVKNSGRLPTLLDDERFQNIRTFLLSGALRESGVYNNSEVAKRLQRQPRRVRAQGLQLYSTEPA